MKNLLQKLRAGLDRFMTGRYGMDRFNAVMLWVSVGLAFLAIIFPSLIGLVLTTLSYALMGFAVFRALSHNIYKRYRENRWFLQQWERLKDREHRYYSCPKCRQSIRVPRGKGKIAITCPKCKEKFIKKT